MKTLHVMNGIRKEEKTTDAEQLHRVIEEYGQRRPIVPGVCRGDPVHLARGAAFEVNPGSLHRGEGKSDRQFPEKGLAKVCCPNKQDHL
jgi:hypothetical protein